MSEPAAKQRQMIDLDEFERRLSRSPAPARADDPLAELARLVSGGEDRFESMFQARPTRTRAPVPPAAPTHEEPHVPDWLVEESHQHQHAEPKHTEPMSPRRQPDFDAIEAGLRGSLPPEFQNFVDAEDHYSHDHHQHSDNHFAEDDSWLDSPYVAPQESLIEPPRSRMPLYATAAIILAGMAGIGGTFALKRTPAAPQEIALIKASTAPVKIAVPGSADADAAGDSSLLDKTSQPPPVAAVSQTEQPVDVNAVGKPPPTTAISSEQVAANAPASAVPVPPPPGGDSAQDLADTMQPHKVKTIAVRPDGSLAGSPDPAILTADPAPAAGGSPVGTIAPPSMAAGGASLSPSTLDMPNMPNKTGDLPLSPQAVPPAAPAPQSADPAPAPHQHKPVRLARAESETDGVVAPNAGGGFSVQLAAPGSQAEAHAALVKLTRNYGAELRGYHLKFHQAKVGSKTVFRVRVGGLSHEAANSLCEKLKAKGGPNACFVAHS